MSTPPIQYSGPPISPDIPWEISQHLQLLYQKIGQVPQGIALLKQQVDAVKAGTTTTNIIGGGGGGSGPAPSSVGITVNNQSGATSYATQASDNLALVVLSDASPIAVSLASQQPPFALFATNMGAGTATFTPATGTINGAGTFLLAKNQTALIAFDGTNWWGSASEVVPATFNAVAHQWLNAYSAATGLFTASQPAFSDISGVLATGQLPSSGLSVTITSAQLTALGTQGSMTFTSGILTAQTPAT